MYIAPLNDSRVEGLEDVQLTLVADQPPTGTCPAYADPAGNTPALPVNALANLADLQIQPPTDTDRPDESTLDGWISQLGDIDQAKRDDASAQLNSAFWDHPDIETYLEAQLADQEDPEVIGRLKEILGPVRLVRSGNSIVASLRYDEPGIANYLVRLPSNLADADFSVDGDPFAQYIQLGTYNDPRLGDPNSITVTPKVEATNILVTLTVDRMSATGTVISSYTRTFAFDIDEILMIA